MSRRTGLLQARSRPGGRYWAGGALIGAALVVAVLAARGPEGRAAWLVTDPVPAGSPVMADALTPVTVTGADSADLWPAPTGVTGFTRRPLAPGELVPTAAVGPEPPDSRRVTLPVADPPAGLAVGETVDVWQAGADRSLLAAVPVTAVVPPDVGNGQVEVLVPAATVPDAVSAAAAERLVLVRHP